MNVELENDIFDDDLEIFEIVNHGFPRQLYRRADHIQSLDNLSFFKRFRLNKETVRNILEQIEHTLEFPYDT